MPNNFADVIKIFVRIITLVIPIIASASFLVFLAGIAKFISKAGDSKNHEEGKNMIIWGVVGLFVMLSLFGILRFALRDFGFGTLGVPVLPTHAKL